MKYIVIYTLLIGLGLLLFGWYMQKKEGKGKD